MPEVRLHISGAKTAIEKGRRRGVTNALAFLLAEADKTVPLETATLQRSGDYDLEASGDEVRGSVYYDTVYARYQHETLTLEHKGQGRAKWLEKTGIEQSTKIGEIIGVGIKREMEM